MKNDYYITQKLKALCGLPLTLLEIPCISLPVLSVRFACIDTVKPVYSGYLGTQQNCPYYRGVLISEVNL